MGQIPKLKNVDRLPKNKKFGKKMIGTIDITGPYE